MNEFFPSTEKTFNLDDEHAVTVRKLDYGEMAAASGAAVARAENTGGENAATLIFLRNEVTVRSVVSWSGPNLDDMPCTRKNISALSLDVGTKIEREAWVFNGGRADDYAIDEDEDDAEKKEFGDTTSA